MTRITSTILPFLTACNPCEIEFVSDTAVVASQCPIETSADESSSSNGEESSSSATTDAASGGDQMPMCVAVPLAGEAWGPCHVGAVCDKGIKCHDHGAGNVCVPECEDDACPAFKCLGGTCNDNAECAPVCTANADCPIPGTFCFNNECVHPAFAP